MAKDPLDAMLDELDSMDAGVQSEPPKSGREAVTASIGDASASFKSSFTNAPLEKTAELAAKSLPRSVGKEVNEALNAKNVITDLYVDNIKDLKSSARNTTELIKTMLPESGPLKSLADKVSRKLGNDEDYSSSSSREPSQEEMITSKLDQLFNREDRRSRVDAIIQQSKEDNKFAQTTDYYQKMLIEHKVGNDFHNTHTMNFYMKNIELGLKQVYIAKQHLELTKSGFDVFKNQFEAIIQNTGLPDLIKLRKREQLGETLSNRAREDLADMLYSNVNPLVAFRENLQKKVEGGIGKVKEGLGGANEALGMADMMGGGGPSYGSMAGSYVAGLATSRAGEAMNQYALKNEKYRDRMYRFKMGSVNLKDTIEDAAQAQDSKGTKTSGIVSNLLRSLGYMVDGDKHVNKKMTAYDPNETTTLDNRMKNSINIIPELLSRIYGEVNAIRRGSDDVTENLYFNHRSNKLEAKGSIKSTIQSFVGKQINSSSGADAKRLVDSINTHGVVEFTDDEKDALSREILGESVRNRSMNLRTLGSKDFLNRLPEDLRRKTKKNLVRNAKEGKRDLTLIDNFSDNIDSMKTNMPMIDSLIEEYFRNGQTETLLDAGLIVADEKGGYSVNEDKYIQLVQDSLESTDGGSSKIVETEEVNPTVDDIKNNLKKKFNKKKMAKEAKKLDKYIKKKAGSRKKVKKTANALKANANDLMEQTKAKIGSGIDSASSSFKEHLDNHPTLDDTVNNMGELLQSDKITSFKDSLKENTEKVTNKIPTDRKSLEDVINNFDNDEFKNGVAEKINLGKGQFNKFKDLTNNTSKNDIVNKANSLGKDAKSVIADYYKIGSGKIDEFMKTERGKEFQTKYDDIITSIDTKTMSTEEMKTYIDKNLFDKYGDDFDTAKNFVKDNFNKVKDGGEEVVETLKSRINNSDLSIDDLLKKGSVSTDELHSVYEQSISAIKGVDFITWSKNLGFDFDGEKFNKSTVTEEFNNMKDSVKDKFMNQIKDMLKDDEGTLDEEPNENKKKKSKLDYLGAILRKTRELDRKMFFGLPKMAMGLTKFLFGTGYKAIGGATNFIKGTGFDFVKTVLTGKGPTEDLRKSEKDKKFAADEQESNKSYVDGIFNKIKDSKAGVALGGLFTKKKAFNDIDGDGDRENSWQDQEQKLREKEKARRNKESGKSNTTVKPKESKGGVLDKILGMLTSAVPLLGGLIGSMGSLGGIVSAVATPLAKLAIKGGAKVVGGAVTAGAAAVSAIKNRKKPGIPGKGPDVDAKHKPSKGKIMSTLKSLKSKLFKKFGKSAGMKIIAKITMAIAKRGIPGIGQAMLAYDAVMITKYLIGGATILGAVSQHFLGFDIDDDEAVAVDDVGNPIEPTVPDNQVRKPADQSGIDKDMEKETNDPGDKGIFTSINDKIQSMFQPNKKTTTGKLVDRATNFFKTGRFVATPDKQDVFKILDVVSERTGVDPNILKAFAGIESSFNPNAKAGTSSAKGLFQFIDSTWTSMLKKYGSKYDIAPGTSPFDPMANALMGAEYIKENTKTLKSVKSEIGLTDLYLGHFLGPGGAKKFLKADPNDIAAGILPSAARSNQNVFFNKNGSPKTISEVYNTLDGRLSRKAKSFGFEGVNMNDAVTATASNAKRETFINNAKEVANRGNMLAPTTPPPLFTSETPAPAAPSVSSSPGSKARKIYVNGKELTGKEKLAYIEDEKAEYAKMDKEEDAMMAHGFKNAKLKGPHRPSEGAHPDDNGIKIIKNGKVLEGKDRYNYFQRKRARKLLTKRDRDARKQIKSRSIRNEKTMEDVVRDAEDQKDEKTKETIQKIKTGTSTAIAEQPSIRPTTPTAKVDMSGVTQVLSKQLEQQVITNSKLDTVISVLRNTDNTLGGSNSQEQGKLTDPTTGNPQESVNAPEPVVDLKKKRFNNAS